MKRHLTECLPYKCNTPWFFDFQVGMSLVAPEINEFRGSSALILALPISNFEPVQWGLALHFASEFRECVMDDMVSTDFVAKVVAPKMLMEGLFADLSAGLVIGLITGFVCGWRFSRMASCSSQGIKQCQAISAGCRHMLSMAITERNAKRLCWPLAMCKPSSASMAHNACLVKRLKARVNVKADHIARSSTASTSSIAIGSPVKAAFTWSARGGASK